MANITKEQKETLALIDAILAMFKNMDTMDDIDINMSYSINPFDFLFKIIEKFASYEELVEWLSTFLVYSLPAIELSLKGVLLANLKSMVDCNNDPRIPNYLRKELYTKAPTDFRKGNGILINLRNVDYTNMLSISPVSEEGAYYYFGTRKYYKIDDDNLKDEVFYNKLSAYNTCKRKGINEHNIIDESEITSIHEMARAKDMNAFLWYVMHRTALPRTSTISGELSNHTSNYSIMGDNGSNINISLTPFSDTSAKTLLEKVDGAVRLDTNNKVPPYVPGDVLKESGSVNVFSLCVSSYTSNEDIQSVNSSNITQSKTPRDCTFTFVPYSDDNLSVNWYVNSKNYYDFLKPKKSRENRDIGKEYGICNFKYSNGDLKLTILPKPFIFTPRLKNFSLIKILFNSRGVSDNNGKYSCKVVNDKPSEVKGKNIKGEEITVCYKYSLDNGYELIVTINDEYYLVKNGAKVTEENTPSDLSTILYECYPKLTVYEFNYDYVMSQQLFEPTVVATRLINSLYAMRFNPRGNINFSLASNKSETAYQMRIAEIVKKIVESTAYEVSDCFYTFDNAKYDAMLNDAELKRSKEYPFNRNGLTTTSVDGSNFNKILSEYSENATLQENIDVFKRAFNQVSADITQEVLPKDVYSFKFNIIFEALEILTSILVESLITPKILILFEVNRILLGNEGEILSIEDLLKALTNLIVGIVRELRDLILKEILAWVLKFLGTLLDILKDAIIKEQLEYYARLIKLLWEACRFNASHRKNLESELDAVDYADIDEIEKPLEDNC